jgi:acyl-CoA synthetase (AMP-forming)/AMP-acid ligase II
MSKGALGLLSAYWPEDTPRYAHVPLKTVGEDSIYAIAVEAPQRIALASAAGMLTYGELAASARAFGAALRNRVARGARVAIAATSAAEMLIAAFGAFEADALALLSEGPPPKEALAAFSPDLVIGAAETASGPAPTVTFEEILTAERKERSGRADFRVPILAMAMPGGRGEVLHSHRSLVGTAVSVGKFYMLAEDITVLLLEPPTNWCTLALALGAFQRGATIWAGWESRLPDFPAEVDYAVCSWARAVRLVEEGAAAALQPRIRGGLIVGIERPFSTSRRLQLGRKLRTDVLTLLGRNDLGPVIGSHPAWYLNDAAGIPLPNVDLRPLNPTDGEPLNIGWEVVESAEIGIKSALAPAGGAAIQGWLRSGLIAQVDPTGFYFLLPEKRVRPA